MKKQFAEDFKNGEIRQGDLLAVLKDEITEFQRLGISVVTQVKNLNKTYDIKLSEQSYRKWVKKHIDSNPKSEVTKAEKSQAELLEKKAAGLNQKKEEKGEEKKTSGFDTSTMFGQK